MKFWKHDIWGKLSKVFKEDFWVNFYGSLKHKTVSELKRLLNVTVDQAEAKLEALKQSKAYQTGKDGAVEGYQKAKDQLIKIKDRCVGKNQEPQEPQPDPFSFSRFLRQYFFHLLDLILALSLALFFLVFRREIFRKEVPSGATSPPSRSSSHSSGRTSKVKVQSQVSDRS